MSTGQSPWEYAFHIRPATTADSIIVAYQRVAMLQEVNRLENTPVLDQLRQMSSEALAPLLGTGEYLGWLAVSDAANNHGMGEVVIGGVGLRLLPSFPRLSADGTQIETSPTPHAVNVYIVPAWRHRGVACRLMQELLVWATSANVDRVTLNASAAARSLYEQLGFEVTNGMQWRPGGVRSTKL